MVNTPLTGLLHYLVQDQLLSLQAAEQIPDLAKQQNLTLTQYLVSTQCVASAALAACCAKHLGLEVVDLQPLDSTLLKNSLMTTALIQHYRALPLAQNTHSLQLAMPDPTDRTTLAAVSFHTGLRIHPVIVEETQLDNFINKYIKSHILATHLSTTLAKLTPHTIPHTPPEQLEDADEPVANFLDHLLQQAIDLYVSDIHIEPDKDNCRVRFRRDGLLAEIALLPLHLATRLATRLKMMANLNIAERRLPQDGRIQLAKYQRLDIRINTCPTLFGEKLVLRLLDIKHINLDMANLGLQPNQQALFLNKLAEPQGLILVTGPTGSGKTMTLYSALKHLNRIEKNIASVEDPVEIQLPGINQVPVNPKIGLDFATVLRALLRQDPDIIMVGEIRDVDTAIIALQAAQTGHLVLSTLHTNSAAETLTRLQSMGVPTYLTTSITLIIAQRLLRVLCPHCQPKTTGCAHCQQGYRGRTAIFELLPADTSAPTLWQAGLEKVQAGITSHAELLRVLGHDHAHAL